MRPPERKPGGADLPPDPNNLTYRSSMYSDFWAAYVARNRPRDLADRVAELEKTVAELVRANNRLVEWVRERDAA